MNNSLTATVGETHRVENVATELGAYNLLTTDTPLLEAVIREGGGWGLSEISDFGAHIGTPEYRELGHLANKYTPELDTHDRFGNRVDLVRYHDAYHQLMTTALENGIHSQPWTDPKPGAHVVRAAKSFMHAQIEAGHVCPVTMTFASIPSIRAQADVAHMFESKILANAYDPRNLPHDQKTTITVGMGMTEKQGGSDIRANSTTATPVGQPGQGELYSLVGHKWFLSAPMCDVFLVLANTEAGVSCFCVPRWLPDGSKNALNIIRLKDKMANRSNASSEVEFRGAQGWLVGEEGRGVPTIIEMVSLTRFDCIGGSAALMRAGVTNAIHHCTDRAAFGNKLIHQPLMRNVLADLSLEYEAAMALYMRMARALDQKDADEHESALGRLMTAVGKYWICKRGPQHTYEVMECIGGSGVMTNSIYPRLYTEAVINPIWEGSGNVQCLDVIRAIGKNPAVLSHFINEVELASGGNKHLDRTIAKAKARIASLATTDMNSIQYQARSLVDLMALTFQASLLVRHAPNEVSDLFCESRLATEGLHNYGALPSGIDLSQIIERSDPGIEHQVDLSQAEVAA